MPYTNVILPAGTLESLFNKKPEIGKIAEQYKGKDPETAGALNQICSALPSLNK